MNPLLPFVSGINSRTCGAVELSPSARREGQGTWAGPSLLWICWVNLGKTLHLSVPQLCYLANEDDNGHLVELYKAREKAHVKGLAEWHGG